MAYLQGQQIYNKLPCGRHKHLYLFVLHEIGTRVLGLEVSVTVELLLLESILLANGDAIGEFGTGGWIHWGFCQQSCRCSRLQQRSVAYSLAISRRSTRSCVMFMSVTSLLISLHDAILFMDVCCQM